MVVKQTLTTLTGFDEQFDGSLTDFDEPFLETACGRKEEVSLVLTRA